MRTSIVKCPDPAIETNMGRRQSLALTLLTVHAVVMATATAQTPPSTTLFPMPPLASSQGVTSLPPDPYRYTSPSPTAAVYEVTTPVGYVAPGPLANRSSSAGKYLLTVPQSAIPGFNFTLGFESFGDEVYEMKASIKEVVGLTVPPWQMEVERVSAYGQFVRDSPALLHLPVPDNLHVGSSFIWALDCLDPNNTRACPFTSQVNQRLYYSRRSSNLNLVRDVTTILVQTDKAIYKPGQLVHYRVFAVYPDLQMYQGNFTIEIRDPNGNKIQFLSEVTGKEGVVEGSLGLADQPVFGDWTIAVNIRTLSYTDTYSKTFTVQEYQLPRYEVVVDIPSYLLTTEPDMHGTVKATYTFGQPVKGMVELRIMSATATQDYCGRDPVHMTMSFEINGEAKFSVPREDISRVVSVYGGSPIKVTAIVKEDLTDVKLEGSATTTFRTTPYKVTILDNTPHVFKPGLPFSVFARGSMIDDSPVTGLNDVISMYITAHYVIPVDDTADESFLFGVSQFTGTYPLPVQTTRLPPDGVVKMDIDIPSNATRLSIRVVFKDLRAETTVDQMFSISNNFLQLSLLDHDLKSGQTATIEARATEPITHLYYQILSRGTVLESKVIDARGQHLMTFGVPLTAKMAPTAHMLAYYVRPDMEIVPDSVAFNIDGIFENEVTLTMSTNMSEPHADLEVIVTADPDSVVSLLAVDQSVLLMKSGNDVSPAEVETAVGSYDRGAKPKDNTFALSLSKMSAQATLEGAGVSVYSDADLTRTEKQRVYSSSQTPSVYGPKVLHQLGGYIYETGTTGTSGTIPPGHLISGVDPWLGQEMTTAMYMPMYPGMPLPTGANQVAVISVGFRGTVPPQVAGQGSGQEGPLKEVERVRSLFPETWLWTNASVGANGSAIIHTTVPDTITSWITTAFATNLKSGLGVTASSTKLTVFRSFFVSLTMPYSVVRGEHVVIQASVFNYLDSDLSVHVSLPGSQDYTSILVSPDGSETLSTADVEYVVTVKSQQQEAVYFPIIPSAVGSVNIEISARSTLAADAVRRPLLVEAEGVPTEFSVPVFINLGPGGTATFSQTFPITLPDDVIDGSKRTRVKVTGDILGPSISGLEELLRMPTGCGEQNMIKLAPDVYIAQYLTSTGQMTPVLKERIEQLIRMGYQRELTYQRSDGAFSTFGNRDATGSTWLTAFVLRVFHEARPYVYVDDGVLQKGLDWLTQRQNKDGSFNEFGFIFDQEMASFKDHSTGLTSFILLALLENIDVPHTERTRAALQYAIGNATMFLEASYRSINPNDYLSLALTTLALTKVSSPAANVAFNTLLAKATNEHGMTYWKVPSNASITVDPYSRWRPTHVRARPVDIHVTAYALLTFAARGLLQEGVAVLHWLTRQRNPYGGFSSTQDTVVGLQALTDFAHRALPNGYNLRVDVRADSSDAHFDVTNNNSLVLQSKDYTFVPSEVTFNATGSGVAIAQLDVFFNVESDLGEQAFDVSTVLLDDYLNSFKVMICTRWLLGGESGMVVQEVGIPSGFAPDMSSVGNVAGIKRTEQRGRYLAVYFEKLTKNSLCYTVMFDRQSMVAHSQPSYVITQDYYEPSNRATATYQSLSLKNSAVCDVCHECCNRT